GLGGDEVEVRSLPADHTADGDDGGVAAGARDAVSRERQLPGARDGDGIDSLFGDAVLEQRGACALDEALRDELVEAAGDDGEAGAPALEPASQPRHAARSAGLAVNGLAHGPARRVRVASRVPARGRRAADRGRAPVAHRRAGGPACRAWPRDTSGYTAWASPGSARGR